jgi:ribosomal protein S18 acetylase RimI-like enzyme
VTPQVLPLTKQSAPLAARLHRECIPTGFLSNLGPGFLRQLYKAVAACPAGFGFVAQDADRTGLGFVACATSTGKLYKQALLRRGPLMALPLLRYAIRPSFLKRMYHTLRYPAQTAQDLPPAEILSIAVSQNARGQGAGKALMNAALDAFAKRDIPNVRVAVWAENKVANAFYQRCGYRLAHTRKHHGLDMNIYVTDLDSPGPAPSDAHHQP